MIGKGRGPIFFVSPEQNPKRGLRNKRRREKKEGALWTAAAAAAAAALQENESC